MTELTYHDMEKDDWQFLWECARVAGLKSSSGLLNAWMLEMVYGGKKRAQVVRIGSERVAMMRQKEMTVHPNFRMRGIKQMARESN